ncbi:MAG: flagellar assembly protein FliH [Rubrivivax sp.]|nr:flagellar assembly protein FliH [Rubrivivax sp.]
MRQVPPPHAGKPTSAYTRFIPREELGEVASWRPGTLGGAGPAAAGGTGTTGAPPPAAPAAEPTAADWQRRVQAARQSGYQDGYRDGLAARENFKQQFAAQATAQVGALLEAFDRQLTALDGQLAQTLARAAVQLAREVVRGELAAQPAQVARVAAEAVGAVMLSARHITVHLHPHDLPLVAEGAEEALAARGARLVADEGVERGGVRVESEVGSVDAGIARRWQQAAEGLAADVDWSETTT